MYEHSYRYNLSTATEKYSKAFILPKYVQLAWSDLYEVQIWSKLIPKHAVEYV